MIQKLISTAKVLVAIVKFIIEDLLLIIIKRILPYPDKFCMLTDEVFIY